MAKKTTPAPKNQAAAEARARAQAQMRAQERKTTVMIWLGVAVAVVLFAALVAFIINQSQAPELGDADGAVPAGSTESGGLPVGTSGVVGVDVPEDALEVSIYADYLCPACAQFEMVVADDLDELREAGTIQLSYHPVSILDRASPTQYSTRSANAAATVADGSPEHFVEYSNLLFANQPAEQGDHWSDAELAQFAIEVGVPADVADAIEDGLFRRWVVGATEQASVDGLQGTPSVMVDGEMLNPDQVPYFQAGALKAYLEERAATQ